MANIKLLLVVFIIVMGFLLFQLWSFLGSESYECLESPLNYGVNRLGSNVVCSCVNDRIMQKDHFGINNTDVWEIKKTSDNPIIIIP